MRPFFYDLIYRFGAPWEIGPRSELVELVESGRLLPSELPRAIDLGCGSGANTIFLAENGFEATGVDYSPVALDKARAKAAAAGASVSFVQGDLTARSLDGVEGPFDLLVDYGTLDDLRGAARAAMRDTIVRLSRPGSRFLMWCFFAARSELPLISFKGPSRLTAVIEPDEERALFGERFEIERLPNPPEGSRAACFLMTRRRGVSP